MVSGHTMGSVSKTMTQNNILYQKRGKKAPTLSKKSRFFNSAHHNQNKAISQPRSQKPHLQLVGILYVVYRTFLEENQDILK